MASEDGEIFVKNLAQFVRTHEKALANALQLRRQVSRNGLVNASNGDASATNVGSFQSPPMTTSTTSALAAAFSLGNLSFTSHNIKPAKLTLTPHHLFYLLSRFEELGIPVGSMNVRLENLRAEASPSNYVSFLSRPQTSQGRSDRDSIHSVSSVRSVMSNMSSLWSNMGMGFGRNVTRTEKVKLQLQTDLKYLYSAFTKIPCLRLSPDRKARLIGGYEEFPFDTAVPLIAFKNVSVLEVFDIDFRQFYGWDKLAEQLRSLTVKRAQVDDPADLLIGVVLDDMDKRRRRSSKAQTSATPPWPASPAVRYSEMARTYSAPGSPSLDDRLGKSPSSHNNSYTRGEIETSIARTKDRNRSTSPTRPTSSHLSSLYRQTRGAGAKVRRSGSGSSTSSTQSIAGPILTTSSSHLLSMNVLPTSKWRFLRHLSLADNALTSIHEASLAPLANSLHSLDLSSNLLSEVPDSLATLTALRALNLSNCMIESLHSLSRNPLPAINSLNLRSNRLSSIAGIQRLLSLERLDLRDNRITDPTEMARLTGIPDIREIWVLSNPFVKSHSGYRVTILNLFRGTPGYTDDIIVDAMPPGYGERRQLRERVLESEGVPVIKSPPLDCKVPVPSLSPNGDPNLTQEQVFHSRRPKLHVAQTEMIIGSGRRKKITKRRIVDLSVDEGQPLHWTQPSVEVSQQRQPPTTMATDQAGLVSSHDAAPTTMIDLLYGQRDDQPGNPRLRLENIAPLSSLQLSPKLPLNTVDGKGHSLANELQHLNLNGEAYRQKVEALKDEFGSGWLSVLTDDAWGGQGEPQSLSPDSDFVQKFSARPDMSSLRTTSQGIISGSRTLG